jgi:hypothetical protein
MSKLIKKKSAVQWKWLGQFIKGHIEEIYFESVTKTIKDKKITRHGTKENPAYLVRSVAGNLALKLQSEIEFSSPSKSVRKKPTLFSK